MSKEKTTRITAKIQNDALEAFKKTVRALLEDDNRNIPNEFYSQALRTYVRVQEEKLTKQFSMFKDKLTINQEQFDSLSFKDRLMIIRNEFKKVAP